MRASSVIPVLAIGIHVALLLGEWRRGSITVPTPWRRHRTEDPDRRWDGRSSMVWDVANAVEAVGLLVAATGAGRFASGSLQPGAVGLALVVTGTGIRWSAIRTLGRMFTGVVMIQPHHRLVREGLYRWVRHPAYTGTIICHIGLGLSFFSWVSVTLSTIPFLAAAAYRIPVEERALRHAFGEAYDVYSADTWRLIPYVY